MLGLNLDVDDELTLNEIILTYTGSIYVRCFKYSKLILLHVSAAGKTHAYALMRNSANYSVLFSTCNYRYLIHHIYGILMNM